MKVFVAGPLQQWPCHEFT